MIESNFGPWIILPIALSIALPVISLYFIIYEEQIFYADASLLFIVLFLSIIIYTFIMMTWGELRTKVVKLYIDNDSITKKSFIGLGYKSNYKFSHINGYKTSTISSRSGTYEYLFLINNGKKVIKLSEFYHENYQILKDEIIRKGIKNLGVEHWSIIKETKEIFQY